MKIIKTTSLTKDQKNTLRNLWNNEYPMALNFMAFSDFEKYLKPLNNQVHFFLLNDKNQIQGWSFTFSRDKEKWFLIILDSKIQRNGFGNLLINKLKSLEPKLNGWVIESNNEVKKNGELYLSPLEFYLKNEFTVNSNELLDNSKISAIKIEWIK